MIYDLSFNGLILAKYQQNCSKAKNDTKCKVNSSYPWQRVTEVEQRPAFSRRSILSNSSSSGLGRKQTPFCARPPPPAPPRAKRPSAVELQPCFLYCCFVVAFTIDGRRLIAFAPAKDFVILARRSVDSTAAPVAPSLHRPWR